MTDLHRVTLDVNGRRHDVEVGARTSLADLLRGELGLTGTHVGCEQGICGTCTVLLDGAPVRSCLLFGVQADGRRVETVEGLAPDGELDALQEAFSRHRALQCGFCTPGFLMLATGLLRDLPADGETDVAEIREALSSNLCRCTGYQGIVDAVCEVAAGAGHARPSEPGGDPDGDRDAPPDGDRDGHPDDAAGRPLSAD